MKQLETFQNKYVPRTDSTQTQEMVSPSPLKMDETGVHSPLNAKNSTVSEHDTASPVQTVTGKDLSNPLKAFTLPKSEEEGSTSSRRRLPKYFQKDSLRKNDILKKKKNEKLEKIIQQTLEKFFKDKSQDKHIIKDIPSPSNGSEDNINSPSSCFKLF